MIIIIKKEKNGRVILEAVVSPETYQVETAAGAAYHHTTFCFPSALSSCLLASLPGCVSCWELCPKIDPDCALRQRHTIAGD